MTTESLEELRRRLLQQESVQRMIQIRAYEIYQMRGCQPGAEAQDWFHAEGEVLAFLIAGESAQNDERAITGSYLKEPETETPQNISEKKRTTAKSGARRTAEAAQAKRQSTASKRASTKKSSKPNAKSTRSRKNSTPESTEKS